MSELDSQLGNVSGGSNRYDAAAKGINAIVNGLQYAPKSGDMEQQTQYKNFKDEIDGLLERYQDTF